MRLFITGVSGFVGGELRRHFEQNGHQVLGTTTGAASAPGLFSHRLGEAVERGWLDGVDVLVHAAWDLAPGASARNLAGSAAWRDAAAARGAHASFISSYSAYADFPTAYGRDKAAAETLFDGPGASTLRPALVVGAGGLFARLVGMVRNSRVLLLLPDGGRHAVELLDVADLCDAVLLCARERRAGAHDLSAGRLPLRQVCAVIARALGRREPPIAPLPLAPVLFALEALARHPRAAELRERLLGYVENGRRERHSTLGALLGRAPILPVTSVLSRAAGVRLGAG